jgi:hypothetical protein
MGREKKPSSRRVSDLTVERREILPVFHDYTFQLIGQRLEQDRPKGGPLILHLLPFRCAWTSSRRIS